MNVYVIASQGGMCKIGKADDPEKRLRELATGHPYKLEVAYVFPCDDAYSIERAAHRLLDARRLSGEWFSIRAAEAAKVIQQLITPVPAAEIARLTDYQTQGAVRLIGALAIEQSRMADAVLAGFQGGTFQMIGDALRKIAERIDFIDTDDDDI